MHNCHDWRKGIFINYILLANVSLCPLQVYWTGGLSGGWKSWNWHSLPLNYTFASCVSTSRSLTHNCNVFCVTNSCNSPIITLCCPTAHRFSYQEAAAKSWTSGWISHQEELVFLIVSALVLCSALQYMDSSTTFPDKVKYYVVTIYNWCSFLLYNCLLYFVIQ